MSDTPLTDALWVSSISATPLTDALWASSIAIADRIELSRRLERDRAMLREALRLAVEHMGMSFDWSEVESNPTMRALEEAIDQARAALIATEDK